MIAIVATDRRGGIGKDGDIPWKSDLDFFKAQTLGEVCIMGRNTWNSLKVQPLPDRTNVVVSTSLPDGRFFKDTPEGRQPFWVFHSATQAVRFVQGEYPNRRHFVIGGAKLYKTYFDLGLIDEVILSKYPQEYECDTFFPRSVRELELMYVYKRVAQGVHDWGGDKCGHLIAHFNQLRKAGE